MISWRGSWCCQVQLSDGNPRRIDLGEIVIVEDLSLWLSLPRRPTRNGLGRLRACSSQRLGPAHTHVGGAALSPRWVRQGDVVL